MPVAESLSEFNRNQAKVIGELAKTRQPLYLTRNGKNAVVVMDADAFDEAMSFKSEVREREMEVYAGILKGVEDAQQGRVSPASDVFARVRSAKGWK